MHSQHSVCLGSYQTKDSTVKVCSYVTALLEYLRVFYTDLLPVWGMHNPCFQLTLSRNRALSLQHADALARPSTD